MIENLRKECVAVSPPRERKDEILRDIARLAKNSPVLSKLSEEDIFRGLSAREALHSTGLAEGIAIPHCSFDTIDDFAVGLIVFPEGVDFKALDGKKTRFVFFIIGPTSHRNRHIKILSSISLLSKEPEKLQSLSRAKTPDEVITLLQSGDSARAPEGGSERSQVTVYIQDEDLFTDVLEILSSDTEGSVTVLEAANAGYYLHRLPLFSSFWSDQDRSYGRIIISIIDKRFTNETIRRINMVRKDSPRGLLITVQDLVYAEGALDF